MSILGERKSGQDVRNDNINAVAAVANILKSSLGPQGLDKMLVDEIGEVTITNDGATIVKMLEVEHPAAKVLVELANLQDSEVGDGTTSVVIIAAELLKRANELIKMKFHPTTIIAGFRTAMKMSVKYIRDNLSMKVETLGDDALLNVAKTSLSSKFVGSQESDQFSEMVVSAMKAVRTPAGKYPVSQVNILKVHGQSTKDSYAVNGYAVRAMRASQAMPSTVTDAKIALLDFDLKKHRMGMNVNIVIDDPEELERVRDAEGAITKEKIGKILAAGANVIFTSRGIDDFAMKYLVDAGVLGVRRVDKKDMNRIAKATGAKVVLTMASLDDEGAETFEPENLGEAESVDAEMVGDNDCVFIKGAKYQKAMTLLLRGPNEYMLDETERSLHDALCTVSRTLESNSVAPGGGAVEAALSCYLEDYARTFDSAEQWAISEFADALLVVPKTLAINAALDAIECVSKLRVHHYTSQSADASDEKKQAFKYTGIDLLTGKVKNMAQAGVLEPMVSKVKSLKFATEAAITILRIDDMIKIAPAQEEEG